MTAMQHPYKDMRPESFWKRGVSSGFTPSALCLGRRYLAPGQKVASAGSCFAANIVPFLKSAGIEYVQTETIPPAFGRFAADNFSYSKFSAAYGNIYTARQARQLLERATGEFRPAIDRWDLGDLGIVDPFRPGLKYTADSHREFDHLQRQHFDRVIEAFKSADVFIFTLGLTEAWRSKSDGAVYPACPGTVAGNYDPDLYEFVNFRASETIEDLSEFIRLARRINPCLKFVLTVSPVPLVATATQEHVVSATIYSKSVLRVAAAEVSENLADVTYFPAYEIVTGPQAPFDYFQDDRREPSDKAIANVMRAFLGTSPDQAISVPADSRIEAPQLQDLSNVIAAALCEEAASEL